MVVNAQHVVTATLLILGAGFLFANARLVLDYWHYRTRRPTALLVWHGRQPPYFGLGLGMAVVLGVVIFYKIIVSGQQAFGETMMFVYYGYLIPLSRRIRRGFYADGIWSDTGFIRYDEVGGLSWREGRALGVADPDFAAAQPRTPPLGASRALRRRAAAAPRQNRRPRNPLLGSRPRPRGAG